MQHTAISGHVLLFCLNVIRKFYHYIDKFVTTRIFTWV